MGKLNKNQRQLRAAREQARKEREKRVASGSPPPRRELRAERKKRRTKPAEELKEAEQSVLVKSVDSDASASTQEPPTKFPRITTQSSSSSSSSNNNNADSEHANEIAQMVATRYVALIDLMTAKGKKEKKQVAARHHRSLSTLNKWLRKYRDGKLLMRKSGSELLDQFQSTTSME